MTRGKIREIVKIASTFTEVYGQGRKNGGLLRDCGNRKVKVGGRDCTYSDVIHLCLLPGERGIYVDSIFPAVHCCRRKGSLAFSTLTFVEVRVCLLVER